MTVICGFILRHRCWSKKKGRWGCLAFVVMASDQSRCQWGASVWLTGDVDGRLWLMPVSGTDPPSPPPPPRRTFCNPARGGSKYEWLAQTAKSIELVCTNFTFWIWGLVWKTDTFDWLRIMSLQILLIKQRGISYLLVLFCVCVECLLGWCLL